MRKFLLSITLLSSLSLNSYAQIEIDDILKKKVDSLKKVLKTAKGNTRIDLLNKIADGFYWLWDDNARHFLDSGCAYTSKAFDQAKRNKYKLGLGYAYLNLSNCQQGREDTSSIPNQNTETHFKQAYAFANKALEIGEELKDDMLIGSVYKHLTWFGKWQKDPNYKTYVQKGILHLERALAQQQNGIHKLIGYTDCSDCVGIEFLLGELYTDLSNFQIIFNDAKAGQIEKAVYYLVRANAPKSFIGRAYLSLSNVVQPFKGIEVAIEYIKKSISAFQDDENEEGALNAYVSLCQAYFNLGDFENGIHYGKKAVRLAEKLAPPNNVATGNGEKIRLFQAYYWIGRLYGIANDFETAFNYMRKARPLIIDENRISFWAGAMGEFYRQQENYDSASYYLTIANRQGEARVLLSTLYISMKQYDKALDYINEIRPTVVERGNLINLGRLYTNLAKVYYGKNDYSTALPNARMGLALTKKTNRNLDRIDNYQILSDIFNKMNQYDSAYIYLKQYTALKDSVLNRQLYIRLNDYKKEAEEERKTGQIKLLQKDNQIKAQALTQQTLLKQKSEVQLALLNKEYEIKNQLLLLSDQQLQLTDQRLREQHLLRQQKENALSLSDKENRLKDQQLKQETFLKNALIAGLFLLLVLSFFVVRNLTLKRRNERLVSEKKQAKLQQQSTELEMQALRAQMNPHFIFNCLSSINKFILKNESRAASDYLTRFSRLIRRVLTNSQLSMIPLSDEIEMLRLYLDMERLRFSNSFDYNIVYANTIEPETLYIPPMLLQPFCENAIWHGLMHKDGQGKLDIVLSNENNLLRCTITDNGIGRAKATELNSKSGEKQKSLGLKITTERLALFNNDRRVESFYSTQDILDYHGNVAGTNVDLKIKYKDGVHEFLSNHV